MDCRDVKPAGVQALYPHCAALKHSGRRNTIAGPNVIGSPKQLDGRMRWYSRCLRAVRQWTLSGRKNSFDGFVKVRFMCQPVVLKYL